MLLSNPIAIVGKVEGITEAQYEAIQKGELTLDNNRDWKKLPIIEGTYTGSKVNTGFVDRQSALNSDKRQRSNGYDPDIIPHAEVNLIRKAKERGVEIKTMVISLPPCNGCASRIINYSKGLQRPITVSSWIKPYQSKQYNLKTAHLRLLENENTTFELLEGVRTEEVNERIRQVRWAGIIDNSLRANDEVWKKALGNNSDIKLNCK